ncbi:hypothetical protein [Actinoplanes philippinensis]|uniref:hypothetical protein n=1 Tax=Actinoplanes philippinensis TaxID=35752 RepID=UPI001EF23CB8|nr:hypothetical protein [Actinoplanes philippinensis]
MIRIGRAVPKLLISWRRPRFSRRFLASARDGRTYRYMSGKIAAEQVSRHVAGRAEIRDTITAVLDDAGTDWAWQGPAGAPERWVADNGPADLDVWCAAGRQSPDPVAALARAYPSAVIADAADPRRLRHTGVAVVTDTGLGVVDFTHGDLRVGPILLIPAAEVTVDPAAHRLTGAAAVADLLVRPVLRGRIPGPERLAEAREAWTAATPTGRTALARRLTAQLGAAVAADLIAAAGGALPDPRLPRRARLRLAARSLAPATIGATWAQRHSIRPAGPSAGPLGLRTRGVVVALVGTDGSGKSTVAAMLGDRLRSRGFPTSQAYFGMARGNLPGVALARRLLNVGSTAPPLALDAAVPLALDAAPPLAVDAGQRLAPSVGPAADHGLASAAGPAADHGLASAAGPAANHGLASAAGPAAGHGLAPTAASEAGPGRTSTGGPVAAAADTSGPQAPVATASALGSASETDTTSVSESGRPTEMETSSVSGRMGEMRTGSGSDRPTMAVAGTGPDSEGVGRRPDGEGVGRRLDGDGDGGGRNGPDGEGGGRNGLDHRRLRRVAAWYYAGEYGWRYLRHVLPALVRGRVVIADRWVYDLRESPWPGSAAARVAEVLVPAPDLLVLPDAPIDVIHRRKPERSVAEQRQQQERFHSLLAESPARCAEMVIDTSGPASGDRVADVVAAVVEAAHRPRGRRR